MKKYSHFVLVLLLLSYVKMHSQINYCQSGKANAAPIYSNQENLRSDSINILKYTIQLEIGNTVNKFIKGNTLVRFAPKLNNQTYLRLDLLKMVIDSVKENASTLTYTYNDTLLKINFTTAKNTVDTSVIVVYYHGVPVLDATGWGGFYYNNAQSAQYAWNLGVGFGAKPHNYGRVWFPCFDNFVERSKYEFHITSDTLRRAVCNGELQSDQIQNNKRTRVWVLNEEIPSYLACVSLANYTQVNWNINALNGNKAITLTANAADTTGLKNAFLNLKSCIHGFENYFGPYMWSRFGYYLIPFNSGAMEHATNIAYPRYAIGNLNNEDLMAHELSHHWWGNLVTCETPEDMWINEGWASFCAHLFFEWQYSKQAYLNRVKTEHDDLLHYLHHREGGFRAVSGLPHNLTYGDHVYKKGADISHTLRGYLGDSAFFAGAKYVLQQKAFQSMNSQEFQQLMQTGSGKNTADFFTNWVMNGGWSHFAIDSISYLNGTPGSVGVQVSVKQKIYGAPALHNNVPLEVACFKSDWSKTVKTITVSGSGGTSTFTLNFQPVYCALNYDSKINDATSHEVKVIKTNGAINSTLAKLSITVLDKGQDSSLVRLVHHYVKPDPFKSNPAGHLLSDQHYWHLEGLISPGFKAKARFNYNGNKTVGGTYSYLDTLLAKTNGDSISLFYRVDARDDWKLVTHVSKVKQGTRHGFIDVDTLKLGEYCFGNSTDLTYLGVRKLEPAMDNIRIYPNPIGRTCTIEIDEPGQTGYILKISSSDGKLLEKHKLQSGVNELTLNELPKDTLLFSVWQGQKKIFSKKIVVEGK